MEVETREEKRLEPVVTEDLELCYQRLGSVALGFAGKTVVVTGAAGFLGSYFVDFLAGLTRPRQFDPCKIIAVDNYSSGKRDRLAHLNGRPNVHVMEADVGNPLSLPQDVDYIIHAASIASPVIYRKYPLETIKANVLGTWNLLDEARKGNTGSFLFLSTSEIYGDPPADQVPTPETHWGQVNPIGPRACYDESKRLGETLCMAYFREYQSPVKICRLFNIYGPRMAPDDGRLISDLMKDASNGQPLTLFSDGKATRSFCYVSDALCQILSVLVLGPTGEVFNIGSDQEITVREVAALVSEMFGGGLPLRFEQHSDRDYVTDNPQRRCPDLSRIRGLASCGPSIDLRLGLQRTGRWHGINIDP